MDLFLHLSCLWARDQDEGLQGDGIWMGMSRGMNEADEGEGEGFGNKHGKITFSSTQTLN